MSSLEVGWGFHPDSKRILSKLIGDQTLKRVQGTKKRVAFTIAEILITLAIVGVVAAMTIQTLIADFQKKSTDDETELHRHGCTALLYLDGFEFKDDYPW